MDERQARLEEWLQSVLQIQRCVLEPASVDASFRRYFRLWHGGRSLIAMDAPPEREDTRAFVKVAGLLRQAGVHAPEIVADNPADGFLLLTDLGIQTYLDVLDEHNADRLFRDALSALIKWQLASRPGILPDYDRALLHGELALFPEWYIGRHLGRRLSSGDKRTLDEIFCLLEDSALAQPQVFVHRDFMPRNLMLSDPNPGVLDFQDAVYGPVSYDVICLFKDAFISWDEQQIDEWLRVYWESAGHAGLPVGGSYGEFRLALDWMGMQRHLKVIGIFARICHRDGKPDYLEDAPRFFHYLRSTARNYAQMTGLLKLLDGLQDEAASI